MSDLNGQLQRAMANQRHINAQAHATYGRERRVAGSLLIEGIGRTGVDIVFPITFVNQPVVVFGQELDVNEDYDVANPPTVEATVSRWVTRQRGPNVNSLLWTGCRILATTRGRATQRQMLTWIATGVAIDGGISKLGATKDIL